MPSSMKESLTLGAS